MVSADHDRRHKLPAGNHSIERKSGTSALTIAEPANACRQSLKLHVAAGELEPTPKVFIFREELHYGLVRAVDVFGLSGQRHPAERSFTHTEERADVGRHETGELEGLLHAGVEGALAQVIPIIEHFRAALAEGQHGLDMPGHRLHRSLRV